MEISMNDLKPDLKTMILHLGAVLCLVIISSLTMYGVSEKYGEYYGCPLWVNIAVHIVIYLVYVIKYVKKHRV